MSEVMFWERDRRTVPWPERLHIDWVMRHSKALKLLQHLERRIPSVGWFAPETPEQKRWRVSGETIDHKTFVGSATLYGKIFEDDPCKVWIRTAMTDVELKAFFAELERMSLELFGRSLKCKKTICEFLEFTPEHEFSHDLQIEIVGFKAVLDRKAHYELAADRYALGVVEHYARTSAQTLELVDIRRRYRVREGIAA